MSKETIVDIDALPFLLTTDELASLLRVDPKTLREMMHRNEIPGCIRMRQKVIRYHRDTVLSWLGQSCGSRLRRK